MKLIEIGALRWQVLAACDHREHCNVLDVLSRLHGPAAMRMLRTLDSHIPERGPDFRNRDKVKHLDGEIWELREQPLKGPKPRVYFFKDGDRTIVTTEANGKRDDDTAPFIKRAKDIRTRYLAAKALGQIVVEKLKRSRGEKA
jgi:hypothetical protein